MLLALWPLFIAMPETANYALLDQQKRDARRLAKRKQLIDEELARRRNVRSNDVITDGRMVAAIDAIIGNIGTGSSTDGILGYDTDGMQDGRGLPDLSGISLAALNLESLEINLAIKRRNDEAFILILANL
jgi:hypothetical protein